MKREYSFKRIFYYDMEKAIQENNICFLLGTRKCGKTVCLHQLQKKFSNAVYTDMKTDFRNDEERNLFLLQAIEDITKGKDIIYLIDEATYMPVPDKSIAKIASIYSEYDNCNTNICIFRKPVYST